MYYDWVGYFIVFIFGFGLSAGLVANKFPARVKQVILMGFIVHALGSMVRYAVLYNYYTGGDAGRYHLHGLKYSNLFWEIGLGAFDRAYWERSFWWGTQATMWFSGIVLSIIGPSKKGEFLFFAILAFLALTTFGKAFERNFRNADLKKYLMLLLFWPSLWFWPSSVGKDALILLATALVVYGYSVRTQRIKWSALIFGLILAAVIRPQVAGILVVSLGVAHWISPGRQFGAVHYFQGLLILVLLFLIVKHGMTSVGVEAFDIDDFKGYIETSSQRSTQGGGAIGTPGVGLLGIPLAFVNILMRPFLWEASNPLSAASSVEMIVFWSLVWRRRSRIAAVAKQWRNVKLLRLAVPLSILYVIALGLAVGNLGIIARQRIHVMPLLLIWIEAIPVTTQKLRDPDPGKRRLRPVPGALRPVRATAE